MPTPEVAEGFVWVETPAGRVLTAEALSAYARHAFTTRDFGARSSGITDCLGALAELLDVERSRIVRARQVHGCGVIDVGAVHELAPGQAADALVSTDTSRPVAVAVADCVPVLLADRRRRAVAAVHAGWRGTAARVVVAAVQALERSGVPASDLVAAIGPSIGPCCYQVDARVRDVFLAGSPEADVWFASDGDGHWRLDLWRANADQLIEAGLRHDTIHVARYCTADHLDDCCSYRKEGAAAGRMFAAIRSTA
jgi:YfiH family protein